MENNIVKHTTPHHGLVFTLLRACTIAKQQENIHFLYTSTVLYLFLCQSCQDKIKRQGRSDCEMPCMLQGEGKSYLLVR